MSACVRLARASLVSRTTSATLSARTNLTSMPGTCAWNALDQRPHDLVDDQRRIDEDLAFLLGGRDQRRVGPVGLGGGGGAASAPSTSSGASHGVERQPATIS